MTLYDKISKNLIKILAIIGLVTFYLVALLGSQDNDMFFEIMSGRDLLNGNFKTASHLNNFPVIVQQWLYSVCLAIFDKLGYFGHISFVFIQHLILWTVSGLFIYRKTKDKWLASIAPIILTLISYEYMINIRPQIITMILLVTEILFIDIYHEKKQLKWLLLVIPILILAANFHQSLFLYHIFMLTPYYFLENYKIDWKLVFVTPVYLVCSLINPYGLDGSLYVFKSLMSNSYKLIHIMELDHLDITTIFGIKIICILALTIYLIYQHRSNRYINFYVFSISILTFIAIRQISLIYFALLYLVIVIDYKKLLSNYALGATAVLSFAACIVFANGAGDLRNTYGEVANVIEDKDAMIYNAAYDVGGYLEYNGYTKVKVDSRCEAFSKKISGEDNILENIHFLSYGYKLVDKHYDQLDIDKAENILKDYDYLVADTSDAVVYVIKDNWINIYEDERYSVWKNPN